MNEKQKTILEIIEQYLIDNPNERFGQALFNLKVNEFTGKVYPEVETNVCRDIFHDSDEDIINRMQLTPLTIKQLRFLTRLDGRLAVREKEFIARYTGLFNYYIKQLTGNEGNLSGYQVDVSLRFCTADYKEKFIVWGSVFQMMEVDDAVLALEKSRIEKEHPEIDKEWCYLMHLLCERTNIRGKSIYEIVHINFEIKIMERQSEEILEYRGNYDWRAIGDITT